MARVKKAYMGTIGDVLKRKYQKLVDYREWLWAGNPTDENFENYRRASDMNDRVFYVYLYEPDYLDWNMSRRKLWGRGHGRTEMGRKRATAMDVKQFGVSDTEQH